MGTKPRFDLFNTGASFSEPDYWESYSPLLLRYKFKLSNLTGLSDLSEETVDCYRLLRNLVTEKGKCDKPGGGLLSMGIAKADFEACSHQLMRRLIGISQYKPSPESSNQNTGIFISKLFADAAIAQVASFTTSPQRQGSVLEVISTKMRKSFESTDVNIGSLLIGFPEMTIWTMMMAGHISTGTNNCGFLAQLFAKSCLVVGIYSMQTELPVFLEEFLWSKAYFNPIFNEFWDNVALAQAVEIEIAKFG